jgi:peptide-methionine (S)-S-oxide reductase
MNQLESIVLGGGCFWCLEAAYQLVEGVEKVEPGYAGGHKPDPSYEEVSNGNTGHTEVVRVSFKPEQISLGQILEVFWAIHDPTTPNRQGNDVGTQYRSAIYYQGESQLATATASLKAAQTLWPAPIVTEVEPLAEFYRAESYHHNYFKNHPDQAYCQVVINPKLDKLRQKFQKLLKSA